MLSSTPNTILVLGTNRYGQVTKSLTGTLPLDRLGAQPGVRCTKHVSPPNATHGKRFFIEQCYYLPENEICNYISTYQEIQTTTVCTVAIFHVKLKHHA